MKHLLSSALLLGVCLFTSCIKEPEPDPIPEPVKVTAVTLNTTSMTMTEGENTSVVATVSPSDASNKKILWTTSNSSVATVNEGTITAVAPGTATITATSDDGGKTASCQVTVKANVISVTSVTLEFSELELIEDEVATLVATIVPANATNQNLIWSTSDPAVAIVENGVVVAVGPGTAVITVSTEDGSVSASCTISVAETYYPVEGVALDKTSVELVEGDQTSLVATVYPSNASNKNISWSSSNPAVAAVDNGTVTAVAPGSATITVTTEDGGFSATCAVTVSERIYPVESVSLDKTSIELVEGDSAPLTATVYPSNASDKNISWSSSNPAAATVDNGIVTAVAPGSATITVTTEDGGFSATCAVTVSERIYPVESVSLDKTSIELVEGDSATLTATILPANATNKNVSWHSSNPAAATVDNGIVTAIAPGSATITVTTEDGGFSATCAVTVIKKEYPVTGITLSPTTLSLKKGESATLVATISPANASNQNISWSSSDSSVATVSDGKVTAVGGGTAIITVKTADGGFTAQCTVTVTVPVEDVYLDAASITLTEGETYTLQASVYPNDSSNKNVSWSSSNPSVASVENGVVTAIKAGSATITVTTEDGGKKDTCSVTVKSKTNLEDPGNGGNIDW